MEPLSEQMSGSIISEASGGFNLSALLLAAQALEVYRLVNTRVMVVG